ncbi:MAG: hypothetical protein STSR0004_02560 [Peptococcaceae bacterium]
MLSMSKVNLDKILGKNSQDIFLALTGSSLMKTFYFAGGTGLALQIGHRRSLDLDFFQKEEKESIPFPKIANEIKQLFGEKLAKLELKQIDKATWNIKGTKVTFLAYPFSLVEPLITRGLISPKLRGIFLASPNEIALMKAYAIGRRTTFRDYIDIYYLLKKNMITLDDIICKASDKFIAGGEMFFSTRLFLEQLVYTKDLEDKEIAINLVTKKQISHEEIEEFLKFQVRRFLNKKLI